MIGDLWLGISAMIAVHIQYIFILEDGDYCSPPWSEPSRTRMRWIYWKLEVFVRYTKGIAWARSNSQRPPAQSERSTKGSTNPLKKWTERWGLEESSRIVTGLKWEVVARTDMGENLAEVLGKPSKNIYRVWRASSKSSGWGGQSLWRLNVEGTPPFKALNIKDILGDRPTTVITPPRGDVLVQLPNSSWN